MVVKFGQSAENREAVSMKVEFNQLEDVQTRDKADESYNSYSSKKFQAGTRPMDVGRTAVWQARLVLLVMINLAQLWILAATIEAALAREYKQLLPLVISSGVCWLIALTIFLWWKPASRRRTNTGYMREK
jgi:hypothetical protein